MQMSTHGDNLIKLTRFTAFNCFLVHEADGFTLVDTNMGGSEKGILQAVEKLGQPITRIVLTHAHVDHVGSLDALAKHLPDAEIAMSERDARFMRGDMRLDPDEPQTPLKGGYPQCETVPTTYLKHGDRIGSLEVIATPGHTPGHIAFMDVRDRTLIAGDAYTTKMGTTTGGTFRLLFPFPAMATWHKPSGIYSAEALRDLNPSRLAVGHGRVIENPRAEMDKAIAEARSKVEEVMRGNEARS